MSNFHPLEVVVAVSRDKLVVKNVKFKLYLFYFNCFIYITDIQNEMDI